MAWKDGNICVCHPREPWADNTPPVIVQNTYSKLIGDGDREAKARYAAAKLQFSMHVAKDVLKDLISVDARDKLVAYTIAHGGIGARILVPHPAFDDVTGEAGVSKTSIPRNALPFAYAAYLKRTLGGELETEIVQIARVGRTKLSKWSRFLYQPSFGGVVRPGQAYILADDVVTTGGTLAALRSYIVRNGGRVVFATAIAHRDGTHQRFAISEQTVNRLLEEFGPDLDQVWTETIGHGIRCLTEAEGKFLGECADAELAEGCPRGHELLQRLRGHLNAAAAKNGT